MAGLSEQSVFTSIESYANGTSVKKQIFEWSETIPRRDISSRRGLLFGMLARTSIPFSIKYNFSRRTLVIKLCPV
jgi:hypothetical protein